MRNPSGLRPKCCEPGKFRLLDFKASQDIVLVFFNPFLISYFKDKCFLCGFMIPVHPKGDQSWVFVGRTVAEAETPIP